MKRLIKHTRGLIKGVPSAVLVSALIHCALLFAAGGLVVFTVIQKQEKRFEPPPPVERKKVELKKPRVKVKKRTRPKTSRRFVSKSVQSMTGIQLPDTISMTEGLGGGVGGFELIPDPSEVSLLGGKSTVSVGNDFEGTFYALSLDRTGKRNSVTMGSYPYILRQFFDSGWNPLSLSAYYRWPQKLYTTFIFIPTIGFEHVPRSFGIPDNLNTAQWIVHYKGRMMAHEDGQFRFWGRGNHVLAVKVDGREVAFLGLPAVADIYTGWRSSARENLEYFTGKLSMAVGDWFELKANQPVEMEVIIGDHNGADTQATLRIQKRGEIYPRNRDGGPILPVFKTAEIPAHLKDEIKYLTIPGDQDLDSELMFNVY
ncbi:hypothetical protein [Tichowtungia aerotolerans]|uniref:Uncharacterized protein n=1 Tax=Tichowtungia aerotolerans TaxID=2697043 RepID=A0A6P1M6E3_9BACT|nr:hypothetical protein [Tichowtungia aerotolerans]QHI68573.1 hypothetical protein GT409_03610 [Tichowtungia aerotolerans]